MIDIVVEPLLYDQFSLFNVFNTWIFYIINVWTTTNSTGVVAVRFLEIIYYKIAENAKSFFVNSLY